MLPGGTPQPVEHRGPIRAFRRRLYQDGFATGAVELAQRGIELPRIGLRIARHAQPIVDALIGPREGEHRDLVSQPLYLAIELMGGDEPRWRARRVVALEAAGMARRSNRFLPDLRAKRFLELLPGDMSGPQEHRRIAGEIGDPGLAADLRGTALEPQADIAAKVRRPVARVGRR